MRDLLKFFNNCVNWVDFVKRIEVQTWGAALEEVAALFDAKVDACMHGLLRIKCYGFEDVMHFLRDRCPAQ